MSYLCYRGTVISSTKQEVLIDFGLSEPINVPKSLMVTKHGEPLVNHNFVDGVNEEWCIQGWFAVDSGLTAI